MKNSLLNIKILLVALFLGAFPLLSYGQVTQQDNNYHDYGLNTKIQNLRPYGKSGIDMFEAFHANNVQYHGFQLKWGTDFTLQWQDLVQSTEGIDATSGNPIPLENIGPGFSLPSANLNLDAQMADGIRLHFVTYLASRHHNDTWVKGGYLQIDKLPMIHAMPVKLLMHFVSVRIGYFMPDYGDAHFRRKDGGRSISNPFIGNYVMDAFTTEEGGEAFLHNLHGLFGVFGITAPPAHGVSPSVLDPQDRTPSIFGKVGYDNHDDQGLRVRLTGSIYHNNHLTDLYHGDRTGSIFFDVMMQPGAEDAWTGRVTPAFSNGFTSVMINPFVKYQGLSVFATYENTSEMHTSRTVNQFAIDGVYRFGSTRQFYVGGRYNTVQGKLLADQNVTADRVEAGAGWFITDNMLLKADYINQYYKDYPINSIYHKAKFHGVMIEATIGF